MNVLNIDLKKINLQIIDTIVEVIGEEFRNIIEERVSNIYDITYNNIEGIQAYYNFLENCKKKELALKFLQNIGIDISSYPIRSYAEPLPSELENLIKKFFYSVSNFDCPTGFPLAIFSFKTNQEQDSVLFEQINFINFLRAKEVDKITRENYNQFKTTEEYQNLMNKINYYLKVHSDLLKELQKYKKEIQVYQDYIDNEKQRKNKIILKKRIELYQEIEDNLNSDIIRCLDAKYTTIEEKSQIINLDGYSHIEFFSKDDMSQLMESNVSENVFIYEQQLKYLEQLGIRIPVVKEDLSLNEKCQIYAAFLQQKDIKKLFPSLEVIEKIKQLKLQKNEEVTKEYICSTSFFQQHAKHFNNEEYTEYLYHLIKEKSVSISAASDDNHVFALLYYTVCPDTVGMLDYIYIHELVHAVEVACLTRSGFDDYVIEERNNYNPQKRKYERLNEVLVDLLALEIRNKLMENNIYLLEPQDRVIYNSLDQNTHSFLRNLVKPLWDKYRNEIICASLSGDISKFTNMIGTENFELFNDSVNKIDYLITMGVLNKLQMKETSDSLVVDFLNETQKLNQIYDNIYVKNSTVGIKK